MFFEQYNLRPMSKEDMMVIYNWRNSSRIRECSLNKNVITIDEHYKWFEKTFEEKDCYYWVFEKSQVPIGFVSFRVTNSKVNQGLWSFYLGETNLPRGTGYIMTTLALKKILYQLNIDSILAEVISTNISSIKLHEKLGFSMVQEERKNEKLVLSYILFKNQY